MNRGVAYVTTPFQLLCVNELLHEKGLVGSCKIYCLPASNRVSREQVQSAAKILDIEVLYPFENIRKNWLRYFLSYMIVFLRSLGVDFLIVGHWSSSINKLALILCNSKRFIVDDGLSSIYYPQCFENRWERLRRERGECTLKDKIRNLRCDLGIFEPDFKKCILYSLFDSVQNGEYPSMPNRFKYFRSKLTKDNVKDSVVVIGAAFAEGGVCSRAVYHEFLKGVVKYLRQKYIGIDIIYYPHRREVSLEALPNLFDRVCGNEQVIEIGLNKSNINPICVVSTSSTSLFSLSTIYNCTALLMWPTNDALFGNSAVSFAKRKPILMELTEVYNKVGLVEIPY